MTDGMGLTSLRNSTLSNNTVTSVLRFEGRTWVRDAIMWGNITNSLAGVAGPLPKAAGGDKHVVTKRMYQEAVRKRRRVLVRGLQSKRQLFCARL